MTDVPRIWISNRTPAPGEIVTVRTMVTHPMETGLRKTADGELIPRNIIRSFTCTLGGEPLFSWAPETAVAQSPYLEFKFMARDSGALRMVWIDDEGIEIKAEDEITIAG